MLDIIILVFLVIHIGNLAKQKGEKVFTWRLYTVLAWITGEILGLVLGVVIFGEDRLIMIVFTALPCAFAGYHIVRSILDKKPDIFEDNINQLGDNLLP